MKYKDAFLEHFKKFPTFRANDAKLFLLKSGASDLYIRKFMSLLVKNGSLYRLTKGNYTLRREISLVGYVFKPFYYGLGTALTHHNLWEQQANQTVITTKNVRQGVRVFFGLNVLIKKLPERFFFGYFKEHYNGFHFYISDVEKTLIDMVYYNFTVEDYVYRNIFRVINEKRLASYLKRYDSNMSFKILHLKQQYHHGNKT